MSRRKYPTVKRRLRPRGRHGHVVREEPEWFDVIVTDNLFGDIITDLAAMIQGGLGIAAGGNINHRRHEHVRADGGQRAQITPTERSYPARGINAAGMMLDSLGEAKAGAAIEAAL